MACDFHTHCLNREIPALVSLKNPDIVPLSSLEFHPWHLPEVFAGLPEGFADKLRRFNALGEIGLDRMHPPSLDIQKKFLNRLLSAASECGKPVVFHIVRAFPELFEALKPFNLRMMIHGFRGKPELLDELWKRGFTVSFHRSVIRNDALLEKLRRPAGAFGFESDDDLCCDINDIIKVVINKSGNRDIGKLSDSAFGEFLYGKS